MFYLHPEDPTWRLRSIRRAMSADEFERTVPIHAGWKQEYYDGMARIRPSWATVAFEYQLWPTDVELAPGLRAVNREDREALRDGFLDAFRVAPEYCDYPDDRYPAQADKYLDGFFGNARGEWSASSRVIERDGRVVAAALVKVGDGPPLLDCLFVRPAFARQGLATRVCRAAFAALTERGEQDVRSYALLANDVSIAWHLRFGFAERPNIMVTQSRMMAVGHELHRRRKCGILTTDDGAALKAEYDRLRNEYHRLVEIRNADAASVYPFED